MRGAGVVLFYGDSVLLCKRASDTGCSFGGHWSPFTGAIEKGESPLRCAVRELKEESGLEIQSFELKYITIIERENSSLVLYAYELDKHFCPVLDFEHTEYGYFRLEDLSFSPRPLDELIRVAIARYVSLIRV